MLGAGIFAALAPATAAAGSGLLLALAAAGVVAYCNVTFQTGQAGGVYVGMLAATRCSWKVTTLGSSASTVALIQ